MKLLYLTFSVIIMQKIFYNSVHANAMNSIYMDCLKEENMSNAQVQAAIKAGKVNSTLCLQSCILTKAGLMKDGKFKINLLRNVLRIKIDNVIPVIMDCTKEVSQETNEHCQIPIKIHRCVEGKAATGDIFI